MCQKIFCPVCYTEYLAEPPACDKCAYPFSGTEIEKQKFIKQFVDLKTTFEKANLAITYSRTILFIIGGINLLVSLGWLFLGSDDLMILPTIVISTFLIVLGFGAGKEPFISLLLGLLSLLLLYGLIYFMVPEKLLTGVIWKLVFLSTLGGGLIKVWRVNRINRLIEKLSD